MPNNQQHTQGLGAIENAGVKVTDPAYELPLPLERALFIRFWKWLSVVGVIVAAITAGAWVLIAAQFIPAAKEAGQTAAKTEIKELTANINKLRDNANTEQIRIDELAGNLTEKISYLTGLTNSASTKAESIEQIYKSSALIAKGFDDVNKAVDKIANNKDLQNALAARLSHEIDQLRNNLTDLQGQLTQMKKFVPFSFTANGCEVGHEVGILFALHDSNVTPTPPSVFLLSGENAAGLTKHEWAQLHVCAW